MKETEYSKRDAEVEMDSINNAAVYNAMDADQGQADDNEYGDGDMEMDDGGFDDD